MTRPRVAVWKFASCDGCQLTLLDREDDLLAVADAVDLVYFLEASSAPDDGGDFDLSLVEGSVTTPADVARIAEIRRRSRSLITIGACATAGGIQALRNFGDVRELMSIVYATPAFLDVLATATPISDHVAVDFELRGCPIDGTQLVEVISASLAGRRPVIASHSVCVECKLAGNPCVLVASATPCLGPVTHAGCGALCPGYNRGCYGCFGPSDSATTGPLTEVLRATGLDDAAIARLFATFNAWAPGFREVAVAAPGGEQR
ncbi:MAG: hypothetical protein RIE08_00795 [Acidimicrobiales bacterium]